MSKKPKKVGNLICQNGVHEVLRCIESVYPIVDEYYVADGGSTDGTYELLKKYAKVYNLKVFRHKFNNMEDQRNFLLSKTPKNCWVINLDQDEKLSAAASMEMSAFLDAVEIEDHKYANVVAMPFYNLNGDILHHMEDPVRYNLTKVFYNDGAWFEGEYHVRLTKGEKDHLSNCVYPPEYWGIFHYAWLNPDRKKNLEADVKSKKRDYNEFEDILKNKKKIRLNIL